MNQIVKEIFDKAMEGEKEWKKVRVAENDFGYERNVISANDGDEI